MKNVVQGSGPTKKNIWCDAFLLLFLLINLPVLRESIVPCSQTHTAMLSDYSHHPTKSVIKVKRERITSALHLACLILPASQ